MIFYNRIELFSFYKGGAKMGKDLRGKEIGAGLSQRKDGRYSARFTSKTGKRIEKYFDKISEAKKWISEAKYDGQHILFHYCRQKPEKYVCVVSVYGDTPEECVERWNADGKEHSAK